MITFASEFKLSPMLLNQFHKRFPDEESCISYFKEIREQSLPKCPKCGHDVYSWIPKKEAFECKKCRHRIPLTKDTVMDHSKLPLRTWFYTMHLITSIKQVLSAKEVQYQLGMEQYPPVWLMMMKLRSIMGKREEMYRLNGKIELDEAFFPTRIEETEKGKPLRRGAGSQRQTKVLVIVESKEVDEILKEYLEKVQIDKTAALEKKAKGRKTRKTVRYIKMFAIENMEASTIDQVLAKSVDKNAVIVTDGHASHSHIKENFAGHIPVVEYNPEKVVKNNLPWVHIVIGECRNGIAAIHKEIDSRFLQLYLNEYCWKFNRRFFRDSSDPKYDLFDRLVKIAAIYTSDIKWRDYPNAEKDDDEVL